MEDVCCPPIIARVFRFVSALFTVELFIAFSILVDTAANAILLYIPLKRHS